MFENGVNSCSYIICGPDPQNQSFFEIEIYTEAE